MAIYKVRTENDRLPIKWNTLEVKDNTSVSVFNYEFVKVSPIALTKEELSNAVLIYSSQKHEFAGVEDVGIKEIVIANYVFEGMVDGVNQYSDTTLISVAAPGTYEGIEVPEAGLYVVNYGRYGVDINLSLERSVKETYELNEYGFYYNYPYAASFNNGDGMEKLEYIFKKDGSYYKKYYVNGAYISDQSEIYDANAATYAENEIVTDQGTFTLLNKGKTLRIEDEGYHINLYSRKYYKK